MRKRILGATAILVIGLAGFLAGRVQGKPPSSQALSAQCAFNVPTEWGEYVGSGAYGLAFRDNNGTLRIINKFPCGLEGAPHVSLEVRRK